MTKAPRPQSTRTPATVDHLAAPATAVPEPKPLLRGWIHAVMAPIALTAGVVLVVLAPPGGAKITSAIYAFTGVLLFTISATYHLGNWSPTVKRVLKRLDHTNIMLVIAGSYTPLAWALLPPQKATVLLIAIWAGALAGVGFRVFYTDAPRWLYTPVYVLLGLAALLFIGDFYAANPAAAILICVGGAFYIAGAVFYALKRPNISERWFGFHELFHAFTIAGFTCHFIAITMAVLGTA
ncbi:PAQR family membrane homeostasis protein TrhA [Paeniglutamicibacter kerguelensis]|uniref:Hemolysin III n=1 Tax=Paeniglutamicibacter kerguelensis TaxID=254788 RepID=A0ABS4X8V0_9MICC|nr:hemolysin III family protein [Paeniglutamicibacter kerguelensis]MBP2384900.1 hemolysin III [Paeniglutamicibacter kerguelensis]